MPPMLEAREMHMMTALDISESEGRLRSIGYQGQYLHSSSRGINSTLTSIIEKHSTGAATLLTSMLANAATNMFATMTVLGRVPALLRTKVAILLSILHFDSAAAMVKPPSRSMITGVHIAENT